MEALTEENLPVPPQMMTLVNKRLRRDRWLKKLTDLRNSEKVKLKQLETLGKESNHGDI